MTPGHEHGHGDRRLLTAALALLVAFLAVEVVAAVLASSLALFADAGHMLVDALALAMALAAGALALRPADERWTFGLGRAEVLSAAVNGITLLVVSAVLVVEAVQRLLHPRDVDGVPLIVVACAGLAVNVVAATLLARADRSSLNIAGAFAHVLTDAYAFAATIVAGVVVLATGFRRADPIASLVVVALMLHAAWRLLRDSGHVLLEATPAHIPLANVHGGIASLPGVTSVHDLHVWTLTSGVVAMSGHLVVRSTPSHAPVVINGKWRGRTPLTVDDLPFGKYTVRVAQPGFEPARDEFTLSATAASHTFEPRLVAEREPAASRGTTAAPPPTTAPASYTGSLYVDSRPRGATVLLDGRSIGQTPVSVPGVPVGSHVVKIEMAGKKPWSSTTRIAAGMIARVTGWISSGDEASSDRTAR